MLKYKVGYKVVVVFIVVSIIFMGIFKKFEIRDKRLLVVKVVENLILL